MPKDRTDCGIMYEYLNSHWQKDGQLLEVELAATEQRLPRLPFLQRKLPPARGSSSSAEEVLAISECELVTVNILCTARDGLVTCKVTLFIRVLRNLE